MSITYRGSRGEIVQEPRSTISVKWKIPMFFSSLQYVNYDIESPSFKFLDADFCLQLYSNRNSEVGQGFVSLYVIKKYSSTYIHNIEYIIGIQETSGQYQTWREVCDFKGNGDAWSSRMHVTTRTRHELLSNKFKTAPDDTLTISCILQAKQMDCTEATTQTALSEGADECAQPDLLSWKNSTEEVDDKISILPKPSGFDKVSEDFENLLVSEEDSDLLVRVKGQDFKVHRAILKARSPVFKAMFRCDMAEGKSGIVDIIDCDPVSFRDFLLFLYCGRVYGLSEDTVLDLYFTADKYDVKNLKIKCISYLMDNTSVGNFCDVIVLALKYNEAELIRKTTNFFMENATKIIITAKWLSFLKENPIEANELYIKAMTVSKA